MNVLTIRTHKRYAMRETVSLRCASGATASGLLIEISAKGARISNLGSASFVAGEHVEIRAADGRKLTGFVRWAHDGLVGIRLERGLHLRDLSELIAGSRAGAEEEQRRYGT